MGVIVHGNKSMIEKFPSIKTMAESLASYLQESEVFVVEGVNTAYELHFSTNSAYFTLDTSGFLEDGSMSINLKMIVMDTVVWAEDWIGLSWTTWLKRVGESIFQGKAVKFSWSYTAEPLKPVFIRDDIAVSSESQESDDDDLAKFASYGDDFRKASGEYRVVGREAIEDTIKEQTSGKRESGGFFEAGTSFADAGEETATPGVADDVGPKRRTTSVVPDGIGEIRVVALKYKGQVIAFRFKTDKGVWDMRRGVATQFGLGEFKTETFITLESVNGLLMSRTERERRRCVPDISDSPEDCEKLMRLMFDIRG